MSFLVKVTDARWLSSSKTSEILADLGAFDHGGTQLSSAWGEGKNGRFHIIMIPVHPFDAV